MFEGKKSLYVGTSSDLRYAYWLGMIERRNKLKKYKRSLKILESINLEKEKPSPEWYTPPEFVEMARQVLGGIDLDPASNTKAQEWIQAKRYYTKNDDGLKQPWSGRIWCNPPYGDFTHLFMQRALSFYESAEIEGCVFLVNRTGAGRYVDLAEKFNAVCQARRRISFLTPEGKPENSPRYYNDFLYLGKDVAAFREVFSAVGRVIL